MAGENVDDGQEGSIACVLDVDGDCGVARAVVVQHGDERWFDEGDGVVVELGRGHERGEEGRVGGGRGLASGVEGAKELVKGLGCQRRLGKFDVQYPLDILRAI